MNLDLFDFLLSPYFAFLLVFLVTVKWIIEMIRVFEFRRLGGLFARLMFLLTYIFILLYKPTQEELRLYLRAAFQLLFIDELINWAACRLEEWRKRKKWTKERR